ncbi:hypothetical protein ACJJTC_007485 [Scirpophaga incertulas]
MEEQAQIWSCVWNARSADGFGSGGLGGSGGTNAGRVLDAGRRKRARPANHRPTKRARPPLAGSSHAVTAPKTTMKRGGSATTTNYLNRKQTLSSTSGLMMRKHYLARQERRKRGTSTRGKRLQRGGSRGASASASTSRSRVHSSSSSGSSADDDEDCAAADCLRPTGKEVDWVQCDGGCDQWFHMHCVGLRRGALREDDDYVCGACAATRPPKPLHSPPNRSESEQGLA